MAKYPRGKLCADDEGELKIAITVKDKTVIIAFEKPITWIGLAKQDAINLANVLLSRANEIEGE